MGNTCYVVATVTDADWRMTVGIRALLMAVCRRPSPSRSLISQRHDLRSESSLALSGYRLPFATSGASAAKLFTEISRFSRPHFVHLGACDASEILFRVHIAKIDRRATQITLRFNACFQLFSKGEENNVRESKIARLKSSFVPKTCYFANIDLQFYR